MTYDKFPVISINPDAVAGEEQLGSKEKSWFRRDGLLCEDWAEKISSEVAHILSILVPRQGAWIQACGGHALKIRMDKGDSRGHAVDRHLTRLAGARHEPDIDLH